MDEINWSNDIYSDVFSSDFDSRFETIDLQSLEMKEKCTVGEVLRTTTETNNLPFPDESRFPLTSNEQLEETLKHYIKSSIPEFLAVCY